MALFDAGLAQLGPRLYRLRRTWWQLRRPLSLGVRALVIRDRELLLVRGHGGTRWHLPGGGVQRRELLGAAAVREVREETGWTVTPERLLGMYTNFSEGKSDHVAIVVCRAVSAAPLRPNIEIAAARWFALTALPPCFGGVHRRLAEYERGASGLMGEW